MTNWSFFQETPTIFLDNVSFIGPSTPYPQSPPGPGHVPAATHPLDFGPSMQQKSARTIYLSRYVCMYLDPHRITAQKGLFPMGGLPLSNERAFEVYKIISLVLLHSLVLSF